MRDHSTIDSHIVSLEEALSCLLKMIVKGPIPSISNAVKQMLNEITQVKQSGRSSAAVLPTPASQDDQQPPNTASVNHWPFQSAQRPSISGPEAPQRRSDNATQALTAPIGLGEVPLERAFPFYNTNDLDLGFDIFAPDLGNYFDFGMQGMQGMLGMPGMPQ